MRGKMIRIFGVLAIGAAAGLPVLSNAGNAEAQGCKGLGQETASVAMAEGGVGFFSEIAKSAPAAAADQVHGEMAFLCD